MELFYISRNFYFRKQFSELEKYKKATIIFREMKLSSPKLQNLYFRRELERPEYQKFQRECFKYKPKRKVACTFLRKKQNFLNQNSLL